MAGFKKKPGHLSETHAAQNKVWNEMGPFDLEGYVNQGIFQVDDRIGYKEFINPNFKLELVGQLEKENNIQGLGRVSFHDGSLDEG